MFSWKCAQGVGFNKYKKLSQQHNQTHNLVVTIKYLLSLLRKNLRSNEDILVAGQKNQAIAFQKKEGDSSMKGANKVP